MNFVLDSYHVRNQVPFVRLCGSTAWKPLSSLAKRRWPIACSPPSSWTSLNTGCRSRLAFCTECGLAQILETVKPEILFYAEYPYFSSVSPSLLRHFPPERALHHGDKALDEHSLVMEAASNDGYMLRNFVAARHSRVWASIRPRRRPQRPRKPGIPTLNPVLWPRHWPAHWPTKASRPMSFWPTMCWPTCLISTVLLPASRRVLKDDGVAVIEAPYVVDLVDHGEFDTIYHQHLCYFSVTALDRLFRRHGLYFNDVKHVAIHGGSLRMFVGAGRARPGFGQGTAGRREAPPSRRHWLLPQLRRPRAQHQRGADGDPDRAEDRGHSIAGYGAAAKATTLMSYCGIDKLFLDYVVDLNKYKHGRYMGGNQSGDLPAGQAGGQDNPDYALILAWNFAREIMKQQAAYREQGGKFIVPIPQPQVVEADSRR